MRCHIPLEDLRSMQSKEPAAAIAGVGVESQGGGI